MEQDKNPQVQDSQEQDLQEQEEHKTPNYRGLYRYVHVSEHTLNFIIIIGIIAIVLCVLYGVMKGGYTVTFDSRGGTDVESQAHEYGETVDMPDPPTREGYTFDGWYVDESCTAEWDFAEDTVESSITLYAGWSGA